VAEARIVGAPDAHTAESQRYFEMLQAKVGAAGLDAVVRFEGRRTSDEVREYLEAAHVFVAPFVELPNGDKDGIPTAVLEAMAAGSAIVASTAGSIDEIIENGRDGLLVGQRDGAALAEAIARVAHDPDLAGRLGEAAAARARREFDVATSERAFHDRIRALVGRRRDVARTVGATS
jgi:glycosyltransferase involved in cell wall biosynthesis